MLSLDTDFYNYQFASVNQQAAFAADICDFIKTIDQVSRFDLGFYSTEEILEQGSLSVGSILKTIIKALWASFKWALSILGKVLNFLVHGYQPGFKRAVSLIEKISKKIPTLQQYTYNYSVSLKTMQKAKVLIERHVEHTEIPGFGQTVPSNKIAIIRKQYIVEFNKLQTREGQVDNNFAMVHPPTVMSGRLHETGVRGQKDFMDIKDQFDEIQKLLVDKLNDLKKGRALKLRQIMNKLQDKAFAMKYVKNKVDVTEDLIGVFEAAIVGQDTKYLKTMQNYFLKELDYYKKKAASVTASEDTDEDEPYKERHETFNG